MLDSGYLDKVKSGDLYRPLYHFIAQTTALVADTGSSPGIPVVSPLFTAYRGFLFFSPLPLPWECRLLR